MFKETKISENHTARPEDRVITIAHDAEREADGACCWSGAVFLAAGNEATGGVVINALIAAVLELACFLKSLADA